MEKELNSKEYLGYAKNLEATIYTNQKILCSMADETHKCIWEEEQIDKPKPPIKASLRYSYVKEKAFTIFIVFIVSFISLSIIFYPINIVSRLYFSVFKSAFIVSIVITILLIILLIQLEISYINISYRNDLKSYETAIENYDKSVIVEKERAKADGLKLDYINTQYDELIPHALEVEKTLENLYSLNIIFPKYRTMAAITQICEYFESGRCTELAGPNGAYNLYESELRMNLLIDRLDLVISNLEGIRRNQYMLYDEICKGNQLVEEVLDSVNYACKKIETISVNTSISAYNTKIISDNTQAIRFYESY